MQFDLTILNVSAYGAGLAEKNAQFSGALSRQADYAQYLTALICIVPSPDGTEEVQHHSERLTVHSIAVKNIFHFYFRAYRKARELHQETPFDVHMVDNPHLGGIFALFLKWRLKTVSVVHSMADMIENPWYTKERIGNHVKAVLITIAAKGADLIRVSTDAEVYRLKQSPLAPKVRKVPFYIDIESFTAQLEAHEKRETNDILYVGRLGPQKDLATLLRAFSSVYKEVPDARLIVVGDGPDRSWVETLAGDLKIKERVVFTGAVPYEEVAGYFRSAACFAISSLYEGTCMALHEAAAAELPIVATAFAGSVDFVRNGEDGYVVPVRNYGVFARALTHVVSDPEARARMGASARGRLDEFDRENALSYWKELCRELSERTSS